MRILSPPLLYEYLWGKENGGCDLVRLKSQLFQAFLSSIIKEMTVLVLWMITIVCWGGCLCLEECSRLKGECLHPEECSRRAGEYLHHKEECSCHVGEYLGPKEECSCCAGEYLSLVEECSSRTGECFSLALYQTSYRNCSFTMQLHTVTKQRPTKSPLKALQMHNR